MRFGAIPSAFLVLGKVAPPSGRAGGRLREHPRKLARLTSKRRLGTAGACPSLLLHPLVVAARRALARLRSTPKLDRLSGLGRAKSTSLSQCWAPRSAGARLIRDPTHARHSALPRRRRTPACRLRPSLHAAQVSLLRHTTRTAGRTS